MELPLVRSTDVYNINTSNSKRSFEKAFGKVCDGYCRKGKEADGYSKTVNNSILWGSRQPNEEDDRKRDEKRHTCSVIYKINKEEEDNYVVGWPPIKTWRRKLLHQNQRYQLHRDHGPLHVINNAPIERIDTAAIRLDTTQIRENSLLPQLQRSFEENPWLLQADDG